ncbi:hypothetical protein Tco_0975631 [Tanacetum coccineum]|uniref:Uncharacterized protein n=1 Tax=Tanacetum coccineum TaxID=301880 RepID=A0ABQ5EEY9_9ASTR
MIIEKTSKLSFTKAEYVAAANCCGQVLWIQNQMLDYGFNFMNTKIHIDNESTICIVKNPVFHSKTKHIEIRHHFIRDSYEKKLIQVIKIHTDHNVADLLTKAFDVSRKAKRTTEISQSSGPIHLVADETVYKEWEDRMERAATTASSLEAEQDSGSGPRCQDTILGGAEAQIRLNLLLPILVYAARHSLTTVRHKLMLPSITSNCWTSAKVKTDNGERQIQALVDKKKNGVCAKTTYWNEFSSTMASAIIYLAINQKLNISKYIFDNMVKNLDSGVKFLMYPRFVQVFLDKQVEGMSKYKGVYVTPSHTKKVFANIKRPCKGFSGRVTPLFSIMMVQATKDIGADLATPIDSYSTPIITQPSSLKPQKKKPRRKQRKDNAPTEPTTEETTPKEHVSNPSYDPFLIKLSLNDLRSSIDLYNPPPSGEDIMQLAELMSLCTNLQEKVLNLEKAKTAQAKEITSLKKRGRKIEDLDADAEVTLVNETQEMNDDNLKFDTGVLEEQEIKFEKVVEEPVVSVATTTKSIPVSTAEVVTTSSASVVIPDELTLAQTLIEIKTAKPKPVTTAATTVTSVRPRAKGIIFHDQEEQVPASTKIFSSSQSQLPQVKDKGKGKLVEPKVPLKKKDQSVEEQSYDEIQKLFDKEMKRENTFMEMNSKVVKGSETRTEESSKRAGDEFSSVLDKSKKQKIDEHVEAEKYDHLEEEEMKRHMEIVQDEEEIAIDAIPLATKPPMIVKYKIVKEGQTGFYQLIRADGSSKRYSTMIRMLQGIDREDLETVWKLVKENHGINKPVDEYERVLWGDLKVMFEPDIKSDVWRNLQGYKVTVWKLFDNCRVHFVRFRNLHIFMLVEKRYPLTPITISNMLNKKLQADRWNKMCYQLLKLMTKQEKVTTAGRINAVRDEIKDISEKR